MALAGSHLANLEWRKATHLTDTSIKMLPNWHRYFTRKIWHPQPKWNQREILIFCVTGQVRQHLPITILKFAPNTYLITHIYPISLAHELGQLGSLPAFRGGHIVSECKAIQSFESGLAHSCILPFRWVTSNRICTWIFCAKVSKQCRNKRAMLTLKTFSSILPASCQGYVEEKGSWLHSSTSFHSVIHLSIGSVSCH